MIKTTDTQKEIGFIHTKHNGNMVNVDHIMTKKDGQMVQIFEQGFTREQETPVLPMTTISKTVGKDLKQYEVYGNSVQDGTPSPDNPIEIKSVGDRTYNLVDISDVLDIRSGAFAEFYDISGSAGTWITLYQEFVSYEDNTSTNSRCNLYFYKDNTVITNIETIRSNYNDGIWRARSATLRVPRDFDKIRVWWNDYSSLGTNMHVGFRNCMLIKGNYTLDTIPPYEPYGYKIPITTTNGIDTSTTNIYLKEPLRKIGDYVDYIDFKNQKVVRNVRETNLNKISDITFNDYDTHWYGYANILQNSAEISALKIQCNKFLCKYPRHAADEETYLANDSKNYPNALYYSLLKTDCPNVSTKADTLQFLKDTNAEVYYALETPIEETISLPQIPTVKNGKTTFNSLTEIEPSKFKIIYKGYQYDSTYSYATMLAIVRSGQGRKFFPVGYEFTTYDSDTNINTVWRVSGHNHHLAADRRLKYTMTVEEKYVYSGSNGDYIHLQFSAPQAFYYAGEGLAAGTYNFTWDYNTGSMVSGTYQFTITKPVPAGGQIVLGTNRSTTAITSCKISTYTAVGDINILEGNIAVTEGTEGTSLGTLSSTSSSTENLNCAQRVMWGSNNNAQSAIRQLINSAEEFAWTPQTKFDRPPTWANTQKGLMHGLPADFLAVVQPAIVPCRTNSVFEIDSLDGTTFTTNQVYNLEDKFFLLSRPEIFGTWDSTSYKDGELLEYYDGLTATERIKRNVAGSAQNYWLRSPLPDHASNEHPVDTTGTVGIGAAYNSPAIARACIIA